VSRLVPHAARSAQKVECEYFVTEPVDMSNTATERESLLIAIEGEGEIEGQTIRAGEVWQASASYPLHIVGDLRLLRTGVPSDN